MNLAKKNKHLSDWGGWKFDIKQSEKVIITHIENLITGLETLGNTYFDFLLDDFPKKFGERDPNKMLELLDGVIPKYVLFNSKITTLIAFAKWYFIDEDFERTETMINKIKTIAATERISDWQKDLIVDPVLLCWQENKEIVFPPIWHSFLLKVLRKYD